MTVFEPGPMPAEWRTCFDIGPDDPLAGPTVRFDLLVDGRSLLFNGQAHIRLPGSGSTITVPVYGEQYDVFGRPTFQVSAEPGPTTFAGVVLFSEAETDGVAFGWYHHEGQDGRFKGPARPIECP